MFTITATRDLTVFSFDVMSKKDSKTEVLVYTRTGDFGGYEETDSGWELILEKTIEMEKGELSNLGALDQEVKIPAGSKQSFYVWSKKGMMYSKGNNQGAAFGRDGSLVINEGVATKDLFNKVTGNARYSGWIR